MTYRHIWEYSKLWMRDPEAKEHDPHARDLFKKLNGAYARGLFKKLNGIEIDYLVNEEALAAFEEELESRGKEMLSRPRNQQFPIKLPGGFALIAVAYGTGKDDYLATVLGFDAGRGKLVTWIANFDVGPQAGDEVACGGGHYFDYRDGENDSRVAEALRSENINCVALEAGYYKVVEKIRRDETLARAWADFFVRSTDLMRKAVRWDIV